MKETFKMCIICMHQLFCCCCCCSLKPISDMLKRMRKLMWRKSVAKNNKSRKYWTNWKSFFFAYFWKCYIFCALFLPPNFHEDWVGWVGNKVVSWFCVYSATPSPSLSHREENYVTVAHLDENWFRKHHLFVISLHSHR